MTGVYQSVAKDTPPFCGKIIDHRILIKVLCVEGEKDEERHEKTPEKGEQMYAKLVPHRALVPPDFATEGALAPTDAVNVVTLLVRLTLFYFLHKPNLTMN